jgi:hypothetical protein
MDHPCAIRAEARKRHEHGRAAYYAHEAAMSSADELEYQCELFSGYHDVVN